MTLVEKTTLIIAGYAALIATGALFLEVRRWFESRPKLLIRLIPDGVVIGVGPQEEKELTIIYVVNRGTEPTTIENLILLEMPTLWRRWKRRATRSFIIPNPQLTGYPPNIPFDLEPNKRWTGLIRKRQDKIADLQTGDFYVAIAASHTDRMVIKRIPKRKPKLPPMAETNEKNR
jgi:hypothetical protein